MEQKNSSFSTNSSNSGNTNTSFRKGPRTPKPQNLFSAPTVKDILNSDDMVPIRIHGTENSLAKSPVKSTPSISEGVELSIPQLTVENSDFRKLLDSVQDSDALNVIGNAKQAKNTMKGNPIYS